MKPLNRRQNECILVFERALEDDEFVLLQDSLKAHFGKDFQEAKISSNKRSVLVAATGVHTWSGDPDVSDGIVVPIRVPLGPFPPPQVFVSIIHIPNFSLNIINLGIIESYSLH